jgi:hypothetical protein
MPFKVTEPTLPVDPPRVNATGNWRQSMEYSLDIAQHGGNITGMRLPHIGRLLH